MLCPNCGTRCATGQKFCRSCGLDLGPVAEALAAHRAQGGTRAGDERRATRQMAERMFRALVVFVLGLLLLSMSKMYGFGRTAMLLGLLTVFASMILAAHSLFGATRAAATPPRPRQLEEESPTTEPLLTEGESEPAPSVTERTTELLEVERKKQ